MNADSNGLGTPAPDGGEPGDDLKNDPAPLLPYASGMHYPKDPYMGTPEQEDNGNKGGDLRELHHCRVMQERFRYLLYQCRVFKCRLGKCRNSNPRNIDDCSNQGYDRTGNLREISVSHDLQYPIE